MKKFYSAVLIVLLCVLPLVSCKKGGSSKEDMKGSVAMVLSGLITDEAFNQYTYEGMQRAAKERNFKSVYKENVSDSEQLEVIRQLASAGYETIIGQGGQFGDSLQMVAREFPDTKFVFSVGNETGGLPNLTAATVSYSHAGYIGGIMAASATKTKKVAMITGVFYANQGMMRDSFKKALQDVDPSIQYTEIETNDWADTDKAYNATKLLIDQGYDVIFPCLDAAGAGVAAACDDSNGKASVVGSVADYEQVYKCKSVIGSAVFDWEGLGYAESLGTLNDGGVHSIGIKDGGIKAVRNNMSDSGNRLLDKAIEDLTNKKINIPD